MSERLTLPQCELIADAALGLCRRHRGRDHTTGTHSARDVTRSVTARVDRGLLEPGGQEVGGWAWRPTERGVSAARRALADLESRVELARRALDAGDGR